MVVLAGLGGGVLTLPSPTSHTFTIPGTGAQNAINLIQQRFPQANANGATARVVFAAPAGQKLSSPADKAAVEAVPTGLAGLIVPPVVLVLTFRRFISPTLPIRHGAGAIQVRMSYDRGDLCVEVHADGAGRPVRRRATAADESGRGLVLLDGLIGMCGGRRGIANDGAGHGKTVYVMICLAAGPAGVRGQAYRPPPPARAAGGPGPPPSRAETHQRRGGG